MSTRELHQAADRRGLVGRRWTGRGSTRSALIDFLLYGTLDNMPDCNVRTPPRGRGHGRGHGRRHGRSSGRGRRRGRGRGRANRQRQRNQNQRRPADVVADPEPEASRDNAVAASRFLQLNDPPPSPPWSQIGQAGMTNGSSQQGGAGRGRNRTTPAWMTAGGGHGDTPRPTEGRGRGDAGHDGPPSSPRSQIEQFLSANSPGNTSSQHGGAGRGRSRTTPAWATAGGGRDDTPRPGVGRGGGTTRL